MDITQLILDDHYEQRRLFAILEQIDPGDTAGVDGGGVLSKRGGDFLFEAGQDLSIGYTTHDTDTDTDTDTVSLYFEESFSFRVVEPDTAVTLTS